MCSNKQNDILIENYFDSLEEAGEEYKKYKRTPITEIDEFVFESIKNLKS